MSCTFVYFGIIVNFCFRTEVWTLSVFVIRGWWALLRKKSGERMICGRVGPDILGQSYADSERLQDAPDFLFT